MKRKQHGFAILEVVVAIAILGLIIALVIFVSTNKKTTDAGTGVQETQKKTETKEVKIKHLGFELGYYDPATNKAGDMQFTKEKIEFDTLFYPYGFEVPANSMGPAKRNPQPTFILPLGTKVHSLVDGEVYNVPKLYSGDYSVMVKGEGSDFIFETEHVINVKVKKGDKVKAGDIIAEVSDYDTRNTAGFGLFEIGILKGGTPPSHVCPFDYLDDSIKDSTLKKITASQKAWEEYRGDTTIYDESKVVIPGCLTRDLIEG